MIKYDRISLMKLVIYLFPFLLLNMASAAMFKKPPTHIKGEAGLTGLTVDDQQTEARVVSFSFFANIKQTIVDGVEAQVIAGGVLETGSNESLFVDEFKPRQDLVLKEASLNYQPIEQISLKAGALNQGEYKSPLLLTDSAFVAAQESLNFEIGDYSFGFFLTQSVPSNHFLTNRLGSVDEGAPSLLMEGIRLHLAGDVMFFKAQVMRFQYNNLSANVAYSSQFLGNSTGGSSQSTTFFLYDYQGYNASFDLGFNINEQSSFYIRGQYLYNDKAPDGRNTGYLLSAGIEINNFKLSVDYFDNESDSSPSFYNSPLFGHNDRDGYGAGLAWVLPKEATQFYIRGYKLNTNQTILISDSTRVFAGVKRSFSFD